MRPRVLNDEKVARIRDVFAKARAAREWCRKQIVQLPTIGALAEECGCSVALIRLIGAGHRYDNEPDLRQTYIRNQSDSRGTGSRIT